MSGAVSSRLIWTFATALGLQVALAAVFVPLQTEKYYDFGGSVGFLAAAFVSLYTPYLRERLWIGNAHAVFPGWRSHAPRQLLVTSALALWAGRLGSFLLARALREGGDSRFEKVKRQPGVFFGYWMGQATWISLVGLPVYMANALPAAAHSPLGPRDFAGLALFSGSLIWEVVADRQKSAWRQDKKEKKHDETFISRGLWGVSRHPNYVGEVGIQTGIWLMASMAMKSPLLPSGIFLAAAISPVFTYLLLNYASGVPPLERAGDKKFGSDPMYQEYKRNTPIFFPWGPRGDFKA